MVRLLFTIFIFTLSFYAKPAKPLDEFGNQIIYTIDYKLKSRFKPIVSKLYRANGYRPLWVGSSAKISSILKSLNSPTLNYRNRNFNKKEIKELSFAIDSGAIPAQNMTKARARLDVMITDGFLQLLHFVKIGDVDWAMVQRKLRSIKKSQDVRAVWEMKLKKMPSTKSLLTAIGRGNINSYLNSQLPLTRRYLSLIKMLKKYKKMPKFSRLHEGRKIKVGMSDDRVAQIKRMLKFFGDYPRASGVNSMYDRTTARAVRSFRSRFKLMEGDYIDNKMIYYLNRKKSDYIKQIITNIEKLKLYPHSFESRFIEVNVPEYKMRLYSGGRVAFSSDVVVGRIDRPTPLFNAKMSYMVLNPTWTIPDNLIKRDLIPMLKKNPNYLQEHNIHVYRGKKEVTPDFEELFTYDSNSKKRVPYRFVQFPSESNALGRVKFMFPNRYAVYLHDTDNKDLFKYRYRVFSSGCMRVQKPFDFMYQLLRYAKGSYSQGKIQTILDSNKPTTIKLRTRIPVHIVYFTVNKVGKKEYFLYDIYLYDQIIWESMRGHKKSSFRVPKSRLDPLRKPKKRKRSFF